ncbi:MAG: UDP-N-acetylglucosamine 1-carboxyvinyltransferase [Acidobacteriota bacterium]|nr:UDP-N-acetylglucosamine 1-carboxyvinyltransferase [Acidobacteriota bacterium]
MDRFIIEGNGPLNGTVNVSGAKNAALPLLAASILTEDHLELGNLPRVQDVATMCALLERIGMGVQRTEDNAVLSGSSLHSHIAPYDLVKTMRASILVLGPMLARMGIARVSLPGGCAIGARPVDLHLKALERMGAEIIQETGYIEARAARLKGAPITFDKVTVTGTENIMMAATLAQGVTVLHNAALEPEVVDLADCLNAMGARIKGQGTSTIVIEGVERLHGATHETMPDRIEAGTWLCAAAITQGHVTVNRMQPEHLTAVLQTLAAAGVPMSVGCNCVEVRPHHGLHARDIVTQPYPNFPTDMQAQMTALMTQASGVSQITETIFENRFMHAAELARMGAQIQVNGRTARVTGGTELTGAKVMATDLRASASLVLAALAAEGSTTINRIYHLDRGYADLETKLQALGGNIRRAGARTKNLDRPKLVVA